MKGRRAILAMSLLHAMCVECAAAIYWMPVVQRQLVEFGISKNNCDLLADSHLSSGEDFDEFRSVYTASNISEAFGNNEAYRSSECLVAVFIVNGLEDTGVLNSIRSHFRMLLTVENGSLAFTEAPEMPWLRIIGNCVHVHIICVKKLNVFLFFLGTQPVRSSCPVIGEKNPVEVSGICPRWTRQLKGKHLRSVLY